MPSFNRFEDYDGLLPESDEVYYYEQEQKKLDNMRSFAYLSLREYESTGNLTSRYIGLEAWRMAIEHEKSQRIIIELEESLSS